MRPERRPRRRGEEPQKRQISMTAKAELPSGASEVDANVLDRRSVDRKHQLVRFSGLGKLPEYELGSVARRSWILPLLLIKWAEP